MPDAVAFADCLFEAQSPLGGLPKWHGARWSALLRHVCARIPAKMENAIAAILPGRNGVAPIAKGERLALRLILRDPAFPARFAVAFPHTPRKGGFSPLSLRLLEIADPLSGRELWPQAGKATLFEEARFRAEAERLASLDNFALHFITPLRLPLPEGHFMRRVQNGIYCQPEFFEDAACLLNLAARVRLRRLREFAGAIDTSALRIAECNLRWEAIRYNAQRQITLGGVVGKLRVQGRPGKALARTLAAGQYLGSGKNGRFGLGFWRIPELAGVGGIKFPEEISGL